MKLDLSKSIDRNKAIDYLTSLIEGEKLVELKEVRETRSQLQNRSLHLYFTLIAYQLNDIGLEFNYDGLNGQEFSLRYTPDLVKNFIWRPIQVALFDIKSTTKINTIQINEVIDVICKFFGDKGIVIEFPSIESLLNK
tara:strand:+ start:1822 stop:2235 length:414 start_codon:yes stop_codon:yes gene_type:complete